MGSKRAIGLGIAVVLTVAAIVAGLSSNFHKRSAWDAMRSLPVATGSSGDPQGKAALVHFWASWCPPCAEELPEFVSESKKWRGRSVDWIAIHLDESWEDAYGLLKPEWVVPPLFLFWDRGGKVAERFGSFQYPETYLLGRDHQVLKKWVGPQDWRSAEIRHAIEQALAD